MKTELIKNKIRKGKQNKNQNCVLENESKTNYLWSERFPKKKLGKDKKGNT